MLLLGWREKAWVQIAFHSLHYSLSRHTTPVQKLLQVVTKHTMPCRVTAMLFVYSPDQNRKTKTNLVVLIFRPYSSNDLLHSLNESVVIEWILVLPIDPLIFPIKRVITGTSIHQWQDSSMMHQQVLPWCIETQNCWCRRMTCSCIR